MKPELLLPAGDFEKLKFAFQYGADAVYAGVPMFSLRARENKFRLDSVKEAVDYTHSIGKKIYLTVNIFPHNYKIPVLIKALQQMAEIGPDAFIMADPGVIQLSRQYAPKVPIHLSVQANNVNWASAQFWHKQGVERIILSREISLPEVKEIHEKNPGLELEFFVHGSICMAYSGRCLLSNYLAYRDANQGTCSHSCRWEYKLHEAHDKNEVPDEEAERRGYKHLDGHYYLEEITRPGQFLEFDEDSHGSYIMNSRDLCLIEYLKELQDAGVCSFKVEGRNKTLYYAATVARTYRRAIDDISEGKPFNRDYLVELAKTSNRGFIPGFITQNPLQKAQDYEKNLSHQTHEFVGVIRGFHEMEGKKYAEMEVKGRLDPGTKVEILTPDDIFGHTVEEIRGMDGRILEAAHPGQLENVLIPACDGIPVGGVIRKERTESDAKSIPGILTKSRFYGIKERHHKTSQKHEGAANNHHCHCRGADPVPAGTDAHATCKSC